MKAVGVLKSFPYHRGIPGHQGGSLPRNVTRIVAPVPASEHAIIEHELDIMTKYGIGPFNAEVWASHNLNITFKPHNMDEKYAGRVLKELYGLKQSFPEEFAKLTHVAMVESASFSDPMGTWGAANRDGSTISLNEYWWTSPEKLEKSLADSVIGIPVGWHPKGCTTIESIIDHEFGHIMYDNNPDYDRFINIYEPGGKYAYGKEIYPSQYAKRNVNEQFAEIFSSSLNTPSNKQIFIVKKFIEKLYGKKKVLKSFPGHLGIPGHQGGSLPRNVTRIVAPKDLYGWTETSINETYKDPSKVQNYSQLAMWMAYHYPSIYFEFSTAEFRLAKYSAMQFDVLAKEYPEVAAHIKALKCTDFVTDEPDHKNVWGLWTSLSDGNSTLKFNSRWYDGSQDDYFNSQLIWGADSLFHPTGCTTIESIMTHEFGHVVRDVYNKDTNTAYTPVVRMTGEGLVADLVGRFEDNNRPTDEGIRALEAGIAKQFWPSEYAKTNISELFAESFASVHHTPSNKQVPYVKKLRATLDFIKTSTRYRNGNWSWMEPGTWDSNKKYFESLDKVIKKMGIKPSWTSWN